MLSNYEWDAAAANDRQRALVAEAEVWRLASSGPARTPILRNGARLIGRGLVGLGALLLRYGRSEYAVVLERGMPASRSAALN